MLNDPARFAPPLPSTDLPGPERKAVTPGQVWAAPIAAWWHKVQPDASLGTAFSIGREPDAAWIVVEVCRASGQTACCDVIVQDGMLLLTVRRPLCFFVSTGCLDHLVRDAWQRDSLARIVHAQVGMGNAMGRPSR